MSSLIHVILNPTSGRGAGRRLRSEVERELTRRGLRFVLEETTRRGHATELARDAALRGRATVVAAGGDGTIHEVVNGLLQAKAAGVRTIPALGVVPIGTGNDFVKSVNGGTARTLAYQVLAHGVVRHFDLGHVTWEGGSEFFVNGVGTGIDVEVVRQITRLPRMPGVFSYLLGLIRALLRFRPIPIHLRIDGEELDRKVMLVAVGNGFCLGGGFRLFPDARADDGHLDICVVDELTKPQIVNVLLRSLLGRHTRHPRVTMRTGVAIEVSDIRGAPIFFQIDGELREPPEARTLRIEIVRGGLPVLTGGPVAATTPASNPILAAQTIPQASS